MTDLFDKDISQLTLSDLQELRRKTGATHLSLNNLCQLLVQGAKPPQRATARITQQPALAFSEPAPRKPRRGFTIAQREDQGYLHFLTYGITPLKDPAIFEFLDPYQFLKGTKYPLHSNNWDVPVGEAQGVVEVLEDQLGLPFLGTTP